MRFTSTVRDFIIGWSVAMAVWFVLRSADIDIILGQKVDLTENIFAFILISIIGGLYFGSLEYLVESKFYGRMPLWRLVFTIAVYHSLGVIFLVIIVFILFSSVFKVDPSLTMTKVLTSESALAFYGYALLVNFGVVFYKQMAYMVGRYKLWKIISGYYYTPKEENRVFLFIDLKDSTKIAENLSHVMYSKFIQDCFYDLKVVEMHGAELYQYVGDEAVLTWHIQDSDFDYNKPLDAYWAFHDRLINRQAHYMTSYDQAPAFKAGVHYGIVTTAEIGSRYRDIAYHGDTINTAARVQQESKNSDGFFLSSKILADQVDHRRYAIHSIGKINLKGKKEPLEIMVINRK